MESEDNSNIFKPETITTNVNSFNEKELPEIDEETKQAYLKHQQWIAKGEHLNEEEDNEKEMDIRTKVDADNVVWQWDHNTKVWYPQVDEQLFLKQQEVYTVIPEVKPVEENKKKRKKKGSKKAWKSDVKNTSVFATGLPKDATFDEIVEIFTRGGGVIKKDAETGWYNNLIIYINFFFLVSRHYSVSVTI